MPLALYCHLPFCRRICPYCDFFKKVPKPGQLHSFIGILAREVEQSAERQRDWARGPADTVYFGGGTPSLHSPEQIAQILDALHAHWEFAEGAEITLEANPGTLTLESLRALRVCGINRLSLGLQSFSSRKLKILYRDHTADESREAVNLAREAGFSNLSLDLIFGLQGETREEWGGDLREALSLKPEHISLYNLEYHERTPFGKWYEGGLIEETDQDLDADLYLLAHDVLTSAGYEHYEVSNYAKPGFHSRHNSAYWNGTPYLGFGPGAHSFDGKDRRFANIADIHRYQQRVEFEQSVVDKEWLYDPQTRWEDWLSVRLRRKTGIDFQECETTWGRSRTEQLREAATFLPSNLRNLSESHLSLTVEGWFVENEILGKLYSLTVQS